MLQFKHVEGKDKGKIRLYALSTCGWCQKTKKLLGALGLAYDYIDADQVDDKTGDEIDREVRKWNPRGTYPTMVVGDKRAIINYDEEKIKELAK